VREGAEIPIRVTDITDASNFYCQFSKDERVQLVESFLKGLGDDPPEEFGGENVPKTGSIVAGRFSDRNWYRVRIEGKTPTPDDFRVYFIDFGNREQLNISALRPIDEGKPCELPSLVASRLGPKESECLLLSS